MIFNFFENCNHCMNISASASTEEKLTLMKFCDLGPASFEKERAYIELNVALSHLCVLIQSMFL